jgi:3-isopropylmalate/(R)-2-methylmalate dehydratase small subunit
MINGFDDIDFLVSKLDAIKEYEQKRTQKLQGTTAL